MPYDTKIEVKDDHIRFTLSGRRNELTETQDAVAAYAPVFRALQKHRLSRLLVIYRLEGRFSPMTGFDHVNNPQAMGWTRDVRVAAVNASSSPIEDLKKIETLIVNRSFPVRLFNDEAEALEWLLD